jgi:hypothetical protein
MGQSLLNNIDRQNIMMDNAIFAAMTATRIN